MRHITNQFSPQVFHRLKVLDIALNGVGHFVESHSQVVELTARLDRDARIEITGLEAPHPIDDGAQVSGNEPDGHQTDN